jgi:hypothetical protein
MRPGRTGDEIKISANVRATSINAPTPLPFTHRITIASSRVKAILNTMATFVLALYSPTIVTHPHIQWRYRTDWLGRHGSLIIHLVLSVFLYIIIGPEPHS